MPLTDKKEPPCCEIGNHLKHTEKTKYAFLVSFAGLLLAAAFIFDSPRDILKGSWVILVSPANLVPDYFALANIGATLLNASVMAFLAIATGARARAEITGLVIASVFTVAGFSMFGKNLYNSLPIMFGVAIYCKLSRIPFRDNLLPAFFGTALAPLVSEISFNLGLPLAASLPLGILAGFLSGLVIPPLSRHFLNFHQGYNLYNIGFTTGIIGTFFIALLRTFGVEVEAISLVSSGNNQSLTILLYGVFLAMLVFGLFNSRWSFRGYKTLLRQSGRLATDFVSAAGFGVALINMALLGIAGTTYVLLVGGELNGPSIGGIFTMAGFGACGKHIKNSIPVILGVFLIGMLNIHEISSTTAILAALFGTTLAPLCGRYGPLAGIVAGAFHMALVTNIGDLHAGMNLYNNGFSGGFIAAAPVPLFNWILKLAKDLRPERDALQPEYE